MAMMDLRSLSCFLNMCHSTLISFSCARRGIDGLKAFDAPRNGSNSEKKPRPTMDDESRRCLDTTGTPRCT